ncbi:MAG TPA: alpha-glucosidase/alpha-galactosidase [Anaerolineae bacterium]|nr:alpha-glucosidase/alpha-galactosidase [Anaerolineae bacterium]
MGKTKIVLIGAGSTSFGVSTVADFFQQRAQFLGSTLVLCDVNEAKLSRVQRLAERMNEVTGKPFVIDGVTDYPRALEGAGFVFVSIEVDRLERWKLDWEIPFKYGVKHVLGENGGPGGLSHALRTIPLVLGIAREMEKSAPDAYLINYVNPLTRVCLGVTRYTKIKTVGMCHQINKGYSLVGQVLGLTPMKHEHFPEATIAGMLKEKIDLKTAGLNHVTWIQDMRDKQTGADLYPEFRARLQVLDPSWEPLSRRLYEAFGLFPATGDGHVGEYFAYAYETSDLKGYDFEGRARESQELDARVECAAQPGAPLDEFLNFESGERGINVAAALLNDLNQYELNVNVVNNGALPGLPDWAIVEVPAVVSGAGVSPLRVPPLPPGITAMLNQQVAIQDRVVEAAVHGDRQAALQALLLDPVIMRYDAAEKMLDELLAVHKDYLPAFG